MFYNQNRQAYWYCSRKGYSSLLERKPEILHLKPIGSIPITLLDHMDRIAWTRSILEFKKVIKGFRSERRLKTFDLFKQKENEVSNNQTPVSYTHLTLPTTPYV